MVHFISAFYKQRRRQLARTPCALFGQKLTQFGLNPKATIRVRRRSFRPVSDGLYAFCLKPVEYLSDSGRAVSKVFLWTRETIPNGTAAPSPPGPSRQALRSNPAAMSELWTGCLESIEFVSFINYTLCKRVFPKSWNCFKLSALCANPIRAT